MSAKENQNVERIKVKKSAFYAAVAEEMIAFTEDNVWAEDRASSTVVGNDHMPVLAVPFDRSSYIVCSMEEGWQKKASLKDDRGKNSHT